MNRTAGVGDHEMLAVRRRWRGKGVAERSKAAQIAWAIDHGLSEIRTNNEGRNTPVRAVNAHFPYAPLPEKLLYRGPCASTQLRGYSGTLAQASVLDLADYPSRRARWQTLASFQRRFSLRITAGTLSRLQRLLGTRAARRRGFGDTD